MPKKKKNDHDVFEDEDEKKTVYIDNPKSLDGVPDLSMLVYLEMKNVLHNVEHRFGKMPRKNPYTSVSTILLAINPYERLPIYGQDVINEFHDGQKKGRLPTGRPHPYGVSARSYMRMIQRKCNQSVIVCGESGAGKTETTKLLMRYLAMTAPSSNMEQSIVEQQIIAASPILEAYGNAKTVLNNNSSRFGKFTKLLYDVPDKAREGRILGSYMETYLLEKSRVVFQSMNERNYHIPYFLYHGLDKADHEKFGIIHPKDWAYANQGGAVEVPGINDVERYIELAESLKLMRIDGGIQADLWNLTCGIFNMGNIAFKKEGDGFASIDPKAQKYLDNVGRLWGLDPKLILERLTTSTMKVMKKNIVKNINWGEDALTNRDSIAKGCYENVFLYLCERINAELYQTDEEDIKSILFIGILDVFGFENFWINSLEQFCINFTNEKLQQFFNFHIIRSEQEEYIKESVFWKPLTVPDNLEYIQFVEDKDYGFYTLLDSACKAPQPDSEAFMQDLFKRHDKKKCVKKITKPGSGNARGGPGKGSKRTKGAAKFDGFEVRHFADLVAYDVSKFLIKNMESVHPDTAKMMKKSSAVLVQEIGGSGPKGRKKKSVTSVFAGGIKVLMKNLMATEPYFVRCVNPNMQKSSTIWTESVVEHQLRCGGLVEALKVLKLGYPTRVPYSTLYDEYHGNVTNALVKNMGPESFSTALLIAFDVDEDDYELGLTKIFFKPSKAAVLDTIMSQAGQPLSGAQNEKITKWVVKKRIKQMVGSCRSFLELRKRVRLTRAEARWRYAGRIAALLGGTVLNHLDIARKNIVERKKKEAALGLQAFFRGSFQRGRYLKRIDKVKKATKMVWICYRRYQDRIELQKWLDVKVEETRKREEERRKREEEERRQREIEEARRKAEEEEAERKRKAAMAEEDRQNYEKQQKEAELARVRAEEDRKVKEEADRKKQTEAEEANRLEEERKKQRDAEEEREKERVLKDEEERKHKEEDDARNELERDAARKRIEQTSLTLHQEKKVAATEERVERKKKRDKTIKSKRDKRRQGEEQVRDDEEDAYIRNNFSEMVQGDSDEDDQDSDYDESDSDSADPVLSIAQQLKQFEKISATGQLFLKYTGKRRRKPQDRIVKVSFDNKYKPKQISWGSGSRHIDFNEILYIAWGHYTPVFEARKDQLDSKLCFSVVGKQQILDVQAQSKEMAELWVRGLRKLIGHTEEKSDKLAKQAMESGNLPGFNKKGDVTEVKRAEREHKKRTKSLMLLQQDLFVMTTTTVFRNLEEERIWDIDQSVRERFNAKALYELALREDIPWRQWNHWVREKIVTYLRENNRIANPQQFGGAGGAGGAPYGQLQAQPSQYGQMQAQPSQYGQMQSQPSQYGQPMGGHRPNQPSFNQLPGYGQQQGAYQQPPPQQQQFIPQNVNIPQQQPMQFNMTQQQMQNMQQMGGAAATGGAGAGAGAGGGGGGPQVGPNGEECTLM